MNKLDLPEKLYKYEPVETLLKILDNGCLKFSVPQDFNDPYDCFRGLVTFETSLEAIKKLRKNARIEETKKKAMLYDMENNPEELSQKLNEILDGLIMKSGITCFSKVFNNMLMWSHYGDKHRGVCIEFQSFKLLKP